MSTVSESFKALGLEEKDLPTHTHILKAWRRLALSRHSDKTGVADDCLMQELNAAKEACLSAVVERDHEVSEHKYVMHICRILEKSIAECCDLQLDLGDGGLVQPTLRKFFWIRTADAMEWVMRCGVGDAAFDQEKEDEIPILCSYYNDFIGESHWGEHDHTMMKVLNRYDKFKAGGYGNFARFIE
jgi:hypothetical protein